MNKKYLIITLTLIIILLSICLIFAQQIMQPAGIYVDEIRNADGTMTFTVRTISYGGSYSPRNVGAIWITNSSNQFVKTIKVWAATYRSRLVKWIASSGNNTTGAITSATLNNHQLHSVSWNGLNYQNAVLPDGVYNVNIEYTESNSTISNPGKYKVVAFSNSTTPVDITPTSDSYFTDMHVVWTPTQPANGTISGTVTDAQNIPIPGAIISTGTITDESGNDGIYTLSLQPGTYNLTCTTTGYEPQFNDNVVVYSNQTTTVNFTLDITAVDDIAAVSNSSELLQNYPNPFNQSTTFKFYLAKNADVSLNVYNTKGQLVKSILNSNRSFGVNEIKWDGTNNNGKRLPSGKYYCLLSVDGITKSKMITLQQ